MVSTALQGYNVKNREVSDTNCKPHSALQANYSAEKNNSPSLQLPFAATGFPLQQSRSIETSGEAHIDMVPQAREFGAQSNKKKGQVRKRMASQVRVSATGQPNEDDTTIPPKSQGKRHNARLYPFIRCGTRNHDCKFMQDVLSCAELLDH